MFVFVCVCVLCLCVFVFVCVLVWAFLCLCVSFVFVLFCVCRITAQTLEILKIRYELNAKFCLILYQRKASDRQEVQTLRETHINYTRKYFNFLS